MHKGDQKLVNISGSSLTILPHGNNETWRVDATLDPEHCNASIDFNVPGKPGPPPVNLTATLWWSGAIGSAAPGETTEWEFTDPSGTLAAATYPLNHWVSIPSPPPVALLVDTDMSTDVDDVGALCIAHELQTRGEATIAAVVHNAHLPSGVGAVSSINAYFGRADIPGTPRPPS